MCVFEFDIDKERVRQTKREIDIVVKVKVDFTRECLAFIYSKYVDPLFSDFI